MNLVCAATLKQRGRGYTDDVMDNLQVCQALTNLASGGADDNEAQGGHLVMQCHRSNVGEMGTLRKGSGSVAGGVPFVSHTLRADGFDASEDGTGRGTPLVPISEVGAKTQMGGGRNGCGIGEIDDPMFTLQAGKQHGVGVRRLTPTECERLQGFPDGWSCLCQPLESYNSNACQCPDGPRYKVMGNAVTVPVIEYLGRMMMKVSGEHGGASRSA